MSKEVSKEFRKLPAGAGAEWLLGGIALFRKAPLALGLLGLIWGGLSAAASMTGQLWLSLVLALLGPILFAGMVYAAREVDLGRTAQPAHLLQGVREGKAGRLLAMLLPQIVALVVVMLLLFVMVGAEQLQQVAKVMAELQANPDPALADTLPAGRLFAWLLVAMVVGVVAGLFTFVAIPEVTFTDSSAFAAMKLSFHASVRNLPALIVMIVLLFIAVFAMGLAVQLIVGLLGLATGPQAANFVGQLVMSAILLPVMGGAVYHAWNQMVGAGPVAPAAPIAAGGFEA